MYKTIYVQVHNGYVRDAVSFNPNIDGYIPINVKDMPKDIMNQCYKVVDNKLVLDEEKNKIFVSQTEEE